MVEESSELEKKAQQLELEWLLSEEVPRLCGILHKCLKDCLRDLAACSVGSPPKEADPGYLPLQHPQGCMRGYLLVDKWKIFKAEFQIRLPRWRKGQPMPASINGTRPWPLSQLLNAHNYVQSAIADVDTLLVAAKRDPPLYNAHQVFQITENVVGTLLRAKDELSSPTSCPLFPTAQHYLSDMLEPSPPRDIVIDAQLTRGGLELMILVYGLSTAVLDAHHVPKSRHPVLDNDKAVVGQLYMYRNQWVELLDRAECNIALPNMVPALSSLTSAVEYTRQIRDRVLPHLRACC